MKIGLLAADSHNFPNLPLMKISAHYKAAGNRVEWLRDDEEYDIVFCSVIFSETEVPEITNAKEVHFGGSGMLEKLKKAGHDDAFITYSGTSGGTSARKITTGSKVRVKAGAKTYSGGSLASFVYSRDHIVKELSGKRAVITYGGTVVAAVNVDDLTLV